MTDEQRREMLKALEQGVICATGKVEFDEPGIVTTFRAFVRNEAIIIERPTTVHGSMLHSTGISAALR